MTAPQWTSKEVGGILSLLRSIRVALDPQRFESITQELDERLPGWEFHQQEMELAEQQAKPGYDPTEPKVPPRRLENEG